MKDMTHTEFLQQAEQQVEEQLKELISVFQNLPEDQLLKPGPNQGWSIAECVEHLNSYADFYLPRLMKAVEKAPDLQEGVEFRHSFLGQYFIKSMDTDQSAKKYKAMKKHRPQGVSDAHTTISDLIRHLEIMLILLRKAEGKNLKKASVNPSLSPILRINAGDAIQFVLTHNRRHLLQARQNISI
jgi:hypothetical protein